MAYRRAKQKVRRVYPRGKSILGSNIFKNPIVAGLLVGGIKNALTGKKIIDIESIKTRVLKMDGSNPAIFLGLGIITHNPALTAIGAYAVIDPPDVEKNEKQSGYSNVGETEEQTEYSNVGENEENTGYSNIGENEENTGYSNIGEIQKIPKKRCVY